MKRVYLDYNATSRLNLKVKKSIIQLMRAPLNPSSLHQEGSQAYKILEDSRKLIQKKLSVLGSHKLIFTSSCTEANNLVLRNFCTHVKFCSQFEHSSVKSLVQSNDIIITQDGIIDLRELEALLKNNRGKMLVSIMYVNNEIGSVQPINKITSLVQQYDCLLHCDMTQAIGKIPVFIKNIDIITLSTHKIGGPVGAAVFLIKNHLSIQPLTIGGGQEFGLRSGTHNILAIQGMKTVFLHIQDIITSFCRLSGLRDYFESALQNITQAVIIAAEHIARIPNTSSIYMPNVSAETQLIFFDMNGFAVSIGAACSSGKVNVSSAHLAIRIKPEVAQNFIRISLGPECTKLEIDQFLRCWRILYCLNNYK